ncbi:MAG: hypothetical protein M3Q03_18475 [Chloroflexota bacterium]|nr:hypothetical protein [Chloroflexota bacterium]
MQSPLESLLDVTQTLAATGVEVALGGSGLLVAMGLRDNARDWDLTTDSPWDRVRPNLDGISWQEAPRGDDRYASAYRLLIPADGHDINLIGRFAIRAPGGVCRLPTIVTGAWNRVPLGSPAVWAVAYRLMGHHDRADLLLHQLSRHGAHPGVVARLLAEPLPDEVRRELAALPRVDMP